MLARHYHARHLRGQDCRPSDFHATGRQQRRHENYRSPMNFSPDAAFRCQPKYRRGTFLLCLLLSAPATRPQRDALAISMILYRRAERWLRRISSPRFKMIFDMLFDARTRAMPPCLSLMMKSIASLHTSYGVNTIRRWWPSRSHFPARHCYFALSLKKHEMPCYAILPHTQPCRRIATPESATPPPCRLDDV